MLARAFDEFGVSVSNTFTSRFTSGGNFIAGGEDVPLSDPDIAALSNGGFVVIYENVRRNSIEFQLLDNNGDDIGRLRFAVEEADLGAPTAVVGLPDGGFAVEYSLDGQQLEARFDSDGNPVGQPEPEPGPVNTIFGTGGNDNLRGTNDNDVIIGGEGDDRLIGRNGDDVLLGGEGSDRLVGGRGDDILVGDGGGRDILVGGEGDDTLFAGESSGRSTSAVMTGGEGADRFVFTAEFGRAVIRDFEDGEDVIAIAVGDFEDLSITEARNGAVMIRSELGTLVLRGGVDADELNADDFIFAETLDTLV